jgi:hypothetical protein
MTSNGDGRNLLTHSRMRAFRKCKRLCFYAYELAIRPTTDPKALRMGKAFAAGPEGVYRLGLPVNDAILQATAEYAGLPAWAEQPEAAEDWRVEAETVRRMLAGYFWRWSNSSVKVLASELVVTMPIVNPETGGTTPIFDAACKIDAVVELPDGRLAVMETKTCGEDISLESDYWRQLRIDQQISMEMLAARHAGYDVQTVLYDVARKPAIRPKLLTKADKSSLVMSGKYFGETFPVDPQALPERESAEMYGARLAADMGERPEFYFARVEIARLDSDLDEFRADLWDTQRSIREAQIRGIWSRNGDACLAFGRCAYFEICSAGRKLTPEDEVPSGFTKLTYVHPELAGDA